MPPSCLVVFASFQLLFGVVAQYGEREVTNLYQILSPDGVPVDFSYNETYSGRGELTSVPGCPKSIDGFPWVYYGNPQRCFLAGHRGPCDPGRILFVGKGSPEGICSCECFQFKGVGNTFLVSPDNRFTFCAVADQVFDNEQKVCYDLQQQGPCAPGEWLVRDVSGMSVTCVPRCPRRFRGPFYYDHKTGRCVDLLLLGTEPGGSVVTVDCPQPHIFVYSRVLQRCVLKRPNDFILLG